MDESRVVEDLLNERYAKAIGRRLFHEATPFAAGHERRKLRTDVAFHGGRGFLG